MSKGELVILGRLEGKEETMSNSGSERQRWGGSGEEDDILEVLSMHWECLGKVPCQGKMLQLTT